MHACKGLPMPMPPFLWGGQQMTENKLDAACTRSSATTPLFLPVPCINKAASVSPLSYAPPRHTLSLSVTIAFA
eukprot:364888-Chlamydomonas_euryale.AAC.1